MLYRHVRNPLFSLDDREVFYVIEIHIKDPYLAVGFHVL